MSDTRIPAIVLQYGRLDLTVRCIASLRAQTHPVEVVLVDGATPGVDGAALQAVAALADRALCLQSNRGYAANNNTAIAAVLQDAGTTAFLLVNHDTELDPGCVARLLATLQAQPRAAQVCPQVRYPDGRLQAAGAWIEPRLFEPRLRGHLEPPEHYDAAAQVEFAPGVTVLVRCEAVRAAGMIPEEYFLYAEDVDWSLRFARAGWETWYCPTAFVLHHDSASVGAWSERKGYYLTRSNVMLARRWLPARDWRAFVRRMTIKLARQSVRHLRRPAYVLGMWRGFRAGLLDHARH